jgi:hypothetical protein
MNIGEFQNAVDHRITSRTTRALITGVLTDTGCEVGVAWNRSAEDLICTLAIREPSSKSGDQRHSPLLDLQVI